MKGSIDHRGIGVTDSLSGYLENFYLLNDIRDTSERLILRRYYHLDL